MANREACELYIEQEIESGLEDGKTPYQVGKELSDWVAKLFEVRINPNTIESRARRHPSFEGKKSKPTETTPDIIKDRKPQGGGARPNAGRKPKEQSPPDHTYWASSFNGLIYQIKPFKMSIDELAQLPQWAEKRQEVVAVVQDILDYINGK